MKLVIFGLAVSSSWGNGHATQWRGLCRALGARGHQVVFFERDTHYYARHRDCESIEGAELCIYPDWETVLPQARRELKDAEASIVTSYCPDGIPATNLVLDAPGLHVFYDLDTPVTLAELEQGRPVSYLGPRGLQDFDLVLSYTGGRALDDLQSRLGAKRVAPLYGCVDPDVHRPVPAQAEFVSDLSYLGTYAADRHDMLERLFLEAARRRPDQRFLLGGPKYPASFPWAPNIAFREHVPPAEHPAFYCSSRFTLNLTRRTMAGMGFCPSARLFEAAACGVPLLSDTWEGLEAFLEPGRDILIAESATDVLEALKLSDLERARLVRAARERVLEEHTATRRVQDLEHAFFDAMPEAESAGRCSR